MELAKTVSSFSKDPSTQVGCIIARPDNTVASMGFNGFPRGITDDSRLEDRSTKYAMILHAEVNAILFSQEPLRGYTCYTCPLPPCSRCAAMLIQAGISRVVSPPAPANWEASCKLGYELFKEAGIEVIYV